MQTTMLQVFHSSDGERSPSSLRPALVKILHSFLYLAVYTAIASKYPVELVWTDKFAAANMLEKYASRLTL